MVKVVNLGGLLQVMVAAGEGRPTVVLPSRGPGQGMPVLPVKPGSAGPPPTRRGKGAARSAQVLCCSWVMLTVQTYMDLELNCISLLCNTVSLWHRLC